MRVPDTELDYEDWEAVALDRYLTKYHEDKHKWAQRVWDRCKRQASGEFFARVYTPKLGQSWQERAKELWEEKKMRRCEALCREFKANKTPQSILAVKKHPEYKTRDQKIEEANAKAENKDS